MEFFEKTLNFISKQTGLRLLSGKLYSTNELIKEGNKIFSPEIQKQYERLIESYSHKEDRRKGYENQILFVEMAFRLGVNTADTSLHILDVGGRGGLFAHICNYYGHSAMATDLGEVLEKSPNRDLLDLFEVERKPLMIKAFEKTPDLGHKFDLVTGFRTRFHSRYTWETGEDKEFHWGIDEWDFFLRDFAVNQTTENARIFFMLNRLQEREKGKIIPRFLKQYFLEKGAKIHYSYLLFNNLSAFR